MLQVNNISFSYRKTPILQDISISLNSGEVLCVMGESGCGKSTLLKIIYGLLDVDKGSLLWKKKPILGPAHHLVPGMSFFKYVAQDFDLMPYTTVKENIGRFLSNIYQEKKQTRIKELLEVIEMTDFTNEKVKNLSGGQQQRVAIAKALAKEPELILLDEPFGQIDNFKKNTLRRKLFSFFKEKNIACIIATHDSNDALSFADNILVIQNHRAIAQGSPKELYKNPKKIYTASLFEDVNKVNINGEEKLTYPHQIKIVKKSDHTATVVNSYFKGFYWLIEVLFEGDYLFLNHPAEILKNSKVNIQFKTV